MINESWRELYSRVVMCLHITPLFFLFCAGIICYVPLTYGMPANPMFLFTFQSYFMIHARPHVHSHDRPATMVFTLIDAPSPTLSCSSADEALYELLGLSKLSLNEEREEEEEASVEQVHSSSPTSVQRLTPPSNCHRPSTPHDDLLLVLKEALSFTQCNYIINRGYQATNDGGHHFGPRYVEEASHEYAFVKLQNPNHHKVCVFKDSTILTWLERVIKNKFHDYIQEWNPNRDSNLYMVNPRLRLLRYDAVHEDVFLPHYDATTTTKIDGMNYESKLTILLYLNTDFDHGETMYYNSLHPSDSLKVTPLTGQVVVFNHELYHASRELQYNEDIKVKLPSNTSTVVGGTKFVLRSDVMFEKKDVEPEEDPSCVDAASFLEIPSDNVTVEPRVAEILSSMNDSNLTDVLVDFLDVSVRTFLVPGRGTLTQMLMDLGVETEKCDSFLNKCEASLERDK